MWLGISVGTKADTITETDSMVVLAQYNYIPGIPLASIVLELTELLHTEEQYPDNACVTHGCSKNSYKPQELNVPPSEPRLNRNLLLEFILKISYLHWNFNSVNLCTEPVLKKKPQY